MPAKKLIEFGWDEPDPAFMRRHLAELERTPFDGCVYHVVTTPAAGGKRENFTWAVWGRRAIPPEALAAAREELAATPFRRFSSNFLRFNTTPADLDWFDDHGAVMANARLAARIAREGRSRGVLLDTEEYQGRLFTYGRQRDASRRSWAEYAEQARRRGRELMEAFQEGFPDLVVFLTFGPSLPYRVSRGGHVPLERCDYGLLLPFCEGLAEGARAGTRIVDGHELSYGFREPERFEDACGLMKKGVLSFVRDPERHRRHFQAGFGIWMDHDWRKHGWDPVNVRKNYFAPEALERAARAALELADEYVWIYSETPRWWSEAGGPVKLPAAYDSALRSARRGLTAD